MHICYRLKVPQVRQSDTPIEPTVYEHFSLLIVLSERATVRHSLFFVYGRLRQPQVHVADLSKFSNFQP
jgi:hypothetical protein